MAKAYALANGFGLDRLALTDWPEEPVPAGHIRVATEAVSLNRRDLLLVEGKYAPRLRFPAIPCSDVAGRVTELGPGCTRFVPGDRVVAHMFQDWLDGPPTTETLRSALGGPFRQGTLRTEIVVAESGLSAVPAFLTAGEAATLPCAALTAWTALTKFAQIGSGHTILVQGTGGVSVFALQLAKRAGATVVATSSSPEKLARLRTLGADFVVDYREADWAETARRHAGGAFDLVVEVVGDLDTAIKSVRPGGTVAVIGVLGSTKAEITLPLVVMRQVALQGVTVGSARDFRAMLAAIEAAKLRPVISDVFPFGRAHDAFLAMRQGGHFGKIVIEVG